MVLPDGPTSERGVGAGDVQICPDRQAEGSGCRRGSAPSGQVRTAVSNELRQGSETGRRSGPRAERRVRRGQSRREAIWGREGRGGAIT